MRRARPLGRRLAAGVLAMVTGALGCAQVLDLPERHAAAHLACRDGVCACTAGFGDCDGNAKNGCESDFASSQSACGACGNHCDNGSCVTGTCQCASGYGDCDGVTSNGCETDLSATPSACGACGHDCLGGACEGGLCMPSVLVADTDGYVTGGLVRVGDAVYFADSKYGSGGIQRSRLLRVPVAGGAIETVHDFGPLEVDDFSGDDATMAVLSLGSLVAFDLASTTTTTLVTDTFDGNYDEMVVAGDDVYYTQGDTTQNRLSRVPRKGGASSFVAMVPPFPPSKLLSVSASKPYWPDLSGGISTVDGAGAVTSWAPAGSGPFDAFHTNGAFFFVERAGILERHPLPSGNVESVPALDPTPGALSILSSSGASLFWLEDAQLFAWEGIAKERLGGAVMPFYRAQLVVTDDAVLYPQNDGIYRVAR